MFAETSRLILRDLKPDDLNDLLAVSSDPTVIRMMEGYLPATEAELRKWLAGTIWHNEQQPRKAHNSAIVLKAMGRTIGWIGFGVPSDPRKGDIDFGYALLSEYHNQGLMTEAVRAMLTFCFDELHAGSITAYHMDFNPASGRVMQKAGMKLFDEMMQDRNDGEVHYIITREMWQKYRP